METAGGGGEAGVGDTAGAVAWLGNALRVPVAPLVALSAVVSRRRRGRLRPLSCPPSLFSSPTRAASMAPRPALPRRRRPPLAAVAAAVAVATAALFGACPPVAAGGRTAGGRPGPPPLAAQALVVGSASRKNALPPLPGATQHRRPRIVGGRTLNATATDSPAPFLAKLFTPTGGYYCGGTLISPRHVLTRAGCDVFPGDLVRVGGVSLIDGVLSRASGVARHPAYAPLGGANDLAVIKLSTAITAAAAFAAGVTVQPAVLATPSTPPAHGYYVAGYGAVDVAGESSGSTAVKRGYQPRVAWPLCRQVLDRVVVPGRGVLPVNETTQVCTNLGATRAGALCERDVGGPMYRVSRASMDVDGAGGVAEVGVSAASIGPSHTYMLYAVASYWIGTAAQLCPQGLPVVGVRVAAYTEWLAEVMA